MTARPATAPTGSGGEQEGVGEVRFRELADNTPALIRRSRAEGGCDWVNRAWLGFTGRTSEDELGTGWTGRVHPEDLEIYRRTEAAALERREIFQVQYRLQRADGAFRWLLENGSPFLSDGDFGGYFASCTDVTDIRASERAHVELLAELNHRVKNNLQLVISMLSLTALRAQSQEAKDLLNATIDRVYGVGTVQEQIYRYAGGPVDFGVFVPAVVAGLLRSTTPDRSSRIVHADPVIGTFQQASTLGVLLNELLAEVLSRGRAEVQVAVHRIADTRCRITLAATGAQAAPVIDHRTIGLVEPLTRSMKGAVDRDFGENAAVSLEFPVESTFIL